jgi:hypothetical protein
MKIKSFSQKTDGPYPFIEMGWEWMPDTDEDREFLASELRAARKHAERMERSYSAILGLWSDEPDATPSPDSPAE